MGSSAGSILSTDLAGVLTMSSSVLATIGTDGGVDEPAYRSAAEQMTSRGYQVPVLVVWAEALTYASPAGLFAAPDDAPGRRLWPPKVLRHAHRVLATARSTHQEPNAKWRLVRGVESSCKRLGSAVDDLVRFMAISAHQVSPVLGGEHGLAQFYKIMALVENLNDRRARGQALAEATCALATAAAGFHDLAEDSVDRAALPSEICRVLLPVAELVMTRGNYIGLTTDEYGVPSTLIDPATADDAALTLAQQLLQASHDPPQRATALAALTAASKQDQHLVARYLAGSIGMQLGELIARHYERTTKGEREDI
jgi:hypothetical protein